MAKQGESLDDVLAAINKKYGSGSIMTLGDTKPVATNLLSTGSLMIDKILGGGIGLGRITELYGVESSGKSTLCLHIAAECQKTGGTVAYIDTENALDTKYAAQLGVDVQKLIFSQPDSAEQALEIVDMLAQSGKVNLIVLDSVAALAPQAELDGEMSDMTIGLVARLLSKSLRKITHTLNEKNCAVIFINQLRDKISTGFSMGPTEGTPGGRALKFFASQRIELRKTTAIKEGADVVGTKVKVKIVKNKISPPMKTCEIPLIFGKGFSGGDEVLDLALEFGLCLQSGAFYTSYDGQRFQGKAKLKAYYEEHPDLFEELKNIVKSKLSGVELEAEYTVDPNTGEIIE